jgi:sialic acid synthase SpsE
MRKVATRPAFDIRGRRVAAGEPLYVVAEIGLNHGGSLDRALMLVHKAAEAGVAAVKLQTLHAESLVAPWCPAPMHVEAASLREFFARFELDEAAHAEVADRAHAAGMAFISTPFDEEAVRLLVRVGADAIKIASGDLTHHRLIACAAETGLPLIISTGMSEIDDVEAALGCARAHGAEAIAILHCVSAYPVPSGSENLGAIRTLSAALGLPVGLSDHGQDDLAVPLAVALGASLYERHIVLDGDGGAIDASVSSTSAQFQSALDAAARSHRMIGHGRCECLDVEAPNRVPSRRGLYAARRIVNGTRLGPRDVVCLRPEHELPANRWMSVIGLRVTSDVPAGAPLTPGVLEGYEGER